MLNLNPPVIAEYLAVEMLEDFLVREDLDEQLEFILLFEVFEGALCEFLPACDFPLEVVDDPNEEFLDGAGLFNDFGVDRGEFPMLLLEVTQLPVDPLQLLLLERYLLVLLRVVQCLVLGTLAASILDGVVAAFKSLLVVHVYLCGEGGLLLWLDGLLGRGLLEEVFYFGVQGQNFPLLRPYVPPECVDAPLLLFEAVEQLPLVVLQELYFFEEAGEHPLILIVLNLLLILVDLLLVVKKGPLYLENVLLVRVNELRLLAFQHRVHLVFKISRETAEVPHQLFYFLHIILSRDPLTLYL